MNNREKRNYATNLLQRLVELDETVHVAYYEMGQILSAFEHGRLFEPLGYDTMGEFIEAELSFSTPTGFSYLRAYRNFKRLGYTKTEALEYIAEFGWTKMSEHLHSADKKLGKRATQNAIDRLYKNRRQVNFCLSADEHALLIEALEEHGAEQMDDRLNNSSRALAALINSYLMQKDRKLVRSLHKKAA